MGKYFTFVDRFIHLEFFEENPVKLTLCVGDDMDHKIDEVTKIFQKPTPVSDKIDTLNGLIGEENADAIMERLDTVDGYALDQVLLYIRETYMEGKVKNLQAAKAGRKRK